MTSADQIDFPVPGGADIPQAVMTQLRNTYIQCRHEQ